MPCVASANSSNSLPHVLGCVGGQDLVMEKINNDVSLLDLEIDCSMFQRRAKNSE